MDEGLIARQIYEQAVQDAEKAVLEEVEPQHIEPKKEVKPRETAADRRNFYRKQAGWPLLKEK